MMPISPLDEGARPNDPGAAAQTAQALQRCVDSGRPITPVGGDLYLDRTLEINSPARLEGFTLVKASGSDPLILIKNSRVTLRDLSLNCAGKAAHGIVNRTPWDNEQTYIENVVVRNSTSHAAVHEDGDAVFIRNFEALYCGAAGEFAWDVQNNFINSSIHITKTDNCGGVRLSKRANQPEGVDISGKIIPYLGRSGIEVHYGLAVDILPGTVIDQVGTYGLLVANGASDVKVTGAYIGGVNGTDWNNPPGNPDAPLITLLGGNQLKLQNVTVQGGASDQLIAFPNVRLLTVRNCDFLNVAPTRSNCNITGLAHSKVMENSFWHARSGGGSLVWRDSGEACYCYDNTAYHGSSPFFGAFGADLIVTGAAKQRDNTRVTLPTGWTH